MDHKFTYNLQHSIISARRKRAYPDLLFFFDELSICTVIISVILLNCMRNFSFVSKEFTGTASPHVMRSGVKYPVVLQQLTRGSFHSLPSACWRIQQNRSLILIMRSQILSYPKQVKTMESVSPSWRGVDSAWKNRISSPFSKIWTKP